MSVVKEWIELWCNSLRAAGTPPEKIFCHIAFTDQGLRKADAKESYAEVLGIGSIQELIVVDLLCVLLYLLLQGRHSGKGIKK